MGYNFLNRLTIFLIIYPLLGMGYNYRATDEQYVANNK